MNHPAKIRTPVRPSVVLLLITTFFSRVACAQPVQFGFTAGGGISNVAKTNNVGVAFEQRNAVADYYAGLISVIKINNDFAFKPAFYIEQKGWTSKYNNLMINLTTSEPYFTISDSVLNSDKVKLNYLKIPLNLSFTLPQVIEGKISIELGPYFAYAVSGTYTSYYGNGSSSLYNFSAGINDQSAKTGIKFNRLDYGLNFNLGYEMNFGLLIHARYELGLHDAVINELITGPAETKFRSLLIGLSYYLGK